jgi:hypothetical protein
MKPKRQRHKRRNEPGISELPVLNSILGELLFYLAETSRSPAKQRKILVARIMNGVLQVVSGDLKRLDLPLASIPALARRRRADQTNFEIDEAGACLYWPSLDVHPGWEQLEQIANPFSALAAQQKSRSFNIRYGRAVRVVRRKAGIKADAIRGLNAERLRRIESGQSQIDTKAIVALAKAHRVSPNRYLEMVAQALESVGRSGKHSGNREYTRQIEKTALRSLRTKLVDLRS